MKIKLFDPHIDHNEEIAIRNVLKSGHWASGSGIGNVAKFEHEFNTYLNSSQCVAVNSGTAALHLALSLFDIKNKEVILPSLSFVSTAHAVVYNGGKPVFVDIDKETLCIDPEKIEKKITNKTKVILPVHFGGIACNLAKIQKICKKHKLFLVEDAAHASGTKYQNKKIGSHGNAVCFSFHPVKNLAMPNGGLIALNGKTTSKFNQILKSLRWCGIDNRIGTKYDVTKLGFNYYMNEFSASIGLAQLKKLDFMNRFRLNIARRYHDELKVEERMPYDNNSSYHLYWIQVNNRSKFMKEMQRCGIETGIHYLPIHKMKFYSNKIKLPITEDVSKKIISIPIHPNLTENNVSLIIKTINKLT